MNSDDLRALQNEAGVPYMSLYGLRIHVRQLQKSRTPWRVSLRVLESLHPLLMENLKVDQFGKISIKNKSMVWERRKGWVEGRR